MQSLIDDVSHFDAQWSARSDLLLAADVTVLSMGDSGINLMVRLPPPHCSLRSRACQMGAVPPPSERCPGDSARRPSAALWTALGHLKRQRTAEGEREGEASAARARQERVDRGEREVHWRVHVVERLLGQFGITKALSKRNTCVCSAICNGRPQCLRYSRKCGQDPRHRRRFPFPARASPLSSRSAI